MLQTNATCLCTTICRSVNRMLCELQDIAKECAVAALPTFQIFKSGSKVDEVVGADVRALTALLEKHNAACSVFSGKGRTLAGAPGPSCLPTLRSCGARAAAAPAFCQRAAGCSALLPIRPCTALGALDVCRVLFHLESCCLYYDVGNLLLLLAPSPALETHCPI